MIVYIAGPVTGKPERNSKAFVQAERMLSERGYTVLNPIRAIPETASERAAMAVSLNMLLQAEALYLLPGWERSKGAYIEFALANKLDMTILEEVEDGEAKGHSQHRSVCE